ncbi:MAG TPA: hypothetical protein EYP14_18605, partial [Planctomycetaceae bacterium]|nr:hypothetical protein [Planctomycetaceae bacterium]
KTAALGTGFLFTALRRSAPGQAIKTGRATRTKKAAEGTTWFDIREWGVEGKGWADTERYFDRLPARAKKVVRSPVWALSRHSAGMCVRFETNAPTVFARYTLLSKRLAMPHMPATGVSGTDLYARDSSGGWRWVGVVRPTTSPGISARVASGLPSQRRAYMLYLPLYNGVASFEIGVPSGASFWPLPPRKSKPIVFYGTSITQGGCASRPGMAYASILGRRLDSPIINLGFSGNGTMDPEVVELLGELDASVFVIDCLPNMHASLVEKRTEPLVMSLRKSRPHTPILLVEDRSYANAWLSPGTRRRNETSRAALRKAYERLVSSGVKGLEYLRGDGLLGNDHEAT